MVAGQQDIDAPQLPPRKSRQRPAPIGNDVQQGSQPVVWLFHPLTVFLPLPDFQWQACNHPRFQRHAPIDG